MGMLDLFSASFANVVKIVVANNPDVLFALMPYIQSGWIVIKGSNLHHEFSAWQEGLAYYLLHLDVVADYFVFVNDTIARPNGHLHAAHLNKLRALMSRKRSGCALGLVHSSPLNNLSMSISGYNASPWISSGLFALDCEIIKLLKFKVDYVDNVAHLVKKNTSGRSLFTEAIDPHLENHILSWLFDGYAGGWNQLRGSVDSTVDSKIIRNKALMILAEKFLSIRLRQVNAQILSL